MAKTRVALTIVSEEECHRRKTYTGAKIPGISRRTPWSKRRATYVSPQTLRSWVAGQSYSRDSRRLCFHALITAPEYAPVRLSFNNIIEAYTLRALRTRHGVSIIAAREAMDVAERACDTRRLLLRPELRTGGGELLLAKYGELVNLTKAGQIAIKHILRDHLARIELDELNIPVKCQTQVFMSKDMMTISPTTRPMTSGCRRHLPRPVSYLGSITWSR